MAILRSPPTVPTRPGRHKLLDESEAGPGQQAGGVCQREDNEFGAGIHE